ncbi:hypothetical protein DNTS_028846 [Danionella cerebrum]|uniref:Leucine rich repeat containing 45 n=1 Tax=Danionella cerebrum TaxID=2873325 RepID=A0A553QFE9_9TELE|nr:hypothetical protein DNTS_028846 [Danionella translucida]
MLDPLSVLLYIHSLRAEVVMEDFRRLYLRLCKEGGIDPQESLLAQLQDSRAGRLDLSGQSLTVDTCSILARILHNDTVCTEVLLSDCMLSEEGVKLMLNSLCSNTTVKVLDLKGNNMRATGAEALGQVLMRNKVLRRLVLEWNALGMWEEGFSVFCEGLASSSSLSQLDLRNNQINHQGAAALCSALKRNSTLQDLDLRWNNIGLLGGRSLLEAMQQNRTLMRLEMAGNNIPSDTLRAIEQSMSHNVDRQSTLRESRSRTQVLSKEIQILKEEKSRQVSSSAAFSHDVWGPLLATVCNWYLSLMDTIDRQKDEMGRSSRNSSVRLGQLQEALSEQKSSVNSLTAKLLKRSVRSCVRLQMMEAALALAEQKARDLNELLTRVKLEKNELRERHAREIKKEQELEDSERRCKAQQDQIFELKQELANSTAELKLRLAQTEERLELEKRRSKQTLEDLDTLRQKEVDHLTRHQEDSERALQERILKLEGQRIQLEEELSRVRSSLVTERAQAQEELGKVRAQVRLEEQQHVSSLEEKLRAVRQSRDESQNHCTQQKQSIAELQGRVGQQSIEIDALRRHIQELQQDLAGKEQQKLAELSRVRVELQEQIGHLQADQAAQGSLKEKMAALQRENKALSVSHREALLDKDSEISSLLERLRIRESEIQRMRDDEAQRATFLQNAVLSFVQSSPRAHCTPQK